MVVTFVAAGLLLSTVTPSVAALPPLDRGQFTGWDGLSATIGARAPGSGNRNPGRRAVQVATSAQLRAAIGNAQPGDVITLKSGAYRLQAGIEVRRAGTADAPIVVRGPALLEFDTVEGFMVAAPYWTFQDLSLRGVCADHSRCEHAFHVVGGAHHFAALNNTLSDFNAHFKINGSEGRFPDHGRIDGNTLSNHSVRNTGNPVTPIDLVAASDWVIRRNLISDFIKQGGDRTSYGAFAKGGGARNVFEQNILWCERLLKGVPGHRVGLSLGDGGTGAPYCRDRRCATEQDDSVIQSNLIMACSDYGIYLNSAARSKVLQNSVIDTDGVVVRFATSSADVEGNLVEGAIRAAGGGVIRLNDNLHPSIPGLYFGRAGAGAEVRVTATPPRRKFAAKAPPDLCGRPRPAIPAYGAWESLLDCPYNPGSDIKKMD